MSTLAVIPARGGSQRIPRKNIKEFLGHPIIWYPIQEALRAFDEVVVSTEDNEIKRVAIECGAGVVDRPDSLADDHTPAAHAVAHAAEMFKHEIVACIYPCAVFARAEMMNRAACEMGDFDSAFTVVQYSHPVERVLRIEGEQVQFDDQSTRYVRTQDFTKGYHDAGQFYIMRRELLLRDKSLFFDRMRAIVLGEHECQDMDTLEDWRMAELKWTT